MFAHSLSIQKFLLLCFDFRAEVLFFLSILLAVGGRPVLLAIVRIVPEFSNEYLPFVLVTCFLPVFSDDVLELRFLDVLADGLVRVDIKPLLNFLDGGVTVDLLHLIEAVDDAFELLFSD